MHPKQFIEGLAEADQSLIRRTISRLPEDDVFCAPILICNFDHRFLAKDECDRAGVEACCFILEPIPRNTAPAITVAALHVAENDPGAILVVMPSDQVIDEPQHFRTVIRHAATVAENGRIVALGIKAIEPHTGYGYIQQGAQLQRGQSLGSSVFAAYEVASFTEKPDAIRAAKNLAAGDYYWNSGIFVCRADILLDEVDALAPHVLEGARASLERAKSSSDFLRLDEASFSAAPSVSFDVAVMEKTKRAAVIPIDLGWSDVGSWTALSNMSPHDERGNHIHGDGLLEDTANCYVRSSHRLVAALGVKDLVIVESPDAVLVANTSRSQDISLLTKFLESHGRKEHERHMRTNRPWGYYEVLKVGARFQVKLLHVKPGGVLSLQLHHHRAEHWIVVQGTANISIEGQEWLMRENQTAYIAPAQWHRLENRGTVPLEMIEVHFGTYLGEDDIIRLDDIYARVPDEIK